MDKKNLARFEILKKMAKDSKGKEVGERLKKKKEALKPAPAKEEPKLSKAQLLLKAKLGDKLNLEPEEDDEEIGEEELEHACPACEDEGCDECPEDEEESEEEAE